MSALPKPVYEAQVSPKLVLLRKEKITTAYGEGSADPKVEIDAPKPERSSSPGKDIFSGFVQTILRRDGARPIRLLAGLVVESSVALMTSPGGGAELRQTLRLYVQPDGRLFVQLQIQPEDDCAVRPVWRVSELSSAEDLSALVVDAQRSIGILGHKATVDKKALLPEIDRAAFPPLFARP